MVSATPSKKRDNGTESSESETYDEDEVIRRMLRTPPEHKKGGKKEKGDPSNDKAN